MNNFFSPGLRVALIIIFVLQIVFMAWLPLHRDLFFYSDVSRDFLLMREMVVNHKLDLIGERAGGVSGFFHGPLWLYINLPVFVLSQGNPVAQAWFWWGMGVLSLGFIWWITGKLKLSRTEQLITVAMVAGQYVAFNGNALNWYGAVLVFPIFFYFLVQTIQRGKLPDYSIVGLTLGAMVQFQIALGAPLCVLTAPILLYQIFRHRSVKPLVVGPLFLLMMAPFFLFEIRHGWTQTQAIFHQTPAAGDARNFIVKTMETRLVPMVGQTIKSVSSTEISVLFLIFSLIHFSVIGMAIYILKQKKRAKNADVFLLFIYFYFGFWTLSLLYPGVIWAYYSWPLTAGLIIFWWLAVRKIYPQLAGVAAAFILTAQLITNIQGTAHTQNFVAQDVSSWQFQSKLAKELMAQSPQNSSVFFFTNDQYGYVPKYAVLYRQDQAHPQITSLTSKQSSTFLVYYPAEPSNPWWNHQAWKHDLVHIQADPVQSMTYPNGVKFERYELTTQDLQIPAESTLITNMIFR